MIRPVSTRDSSLRSEWHAKGVFCHYERAFRRGRIPAACVRVGLGQLSWFVILNELLGRGRISAIWVKVWVVKILLPFKHDSSNEYAGFFTAFRMTCRVVFCHSERAFGRGRIPAACVRVGLGQLSWFVILNELLGRGRIPALRRLVEVFKLLTPFIYDSSNEYAGFFTAFWMTGRVVLCHSERAFGRGRIPTLRRLVEVFKLLISFIYDSSNEYAGFFTAFRMTSQGSFLQFWPVFLIPKPVYPQYAALFLWDNFPITTSLRISQKEYKKKLARM